MKSLSKIRIKILLITFIDQLINIEAVTFTNKIATTRLTTTRLTTARLTTRLSSTLAIATLNNNLYLGK
jgi:hypothetical protein